MSPPAFYYCNIKGQVTDQNNNPQENVDIEWDRKDDNKFVVIARTDSEGNYTTRIAPIPSGQSEQKLRAMDQLEQPTVSPFITVTVNFTL